MHIEGLSEEEAARRFGYHTGSVQNLAAQFRRSWKGIMLYSCYSTI